MTKILIDEATVKLALEALEYIEHNYMSLPAPAEKAITSLREALAEQPAQQALDKMAENARELGLDYEPAQQEPVQNNPFDCGVYLGSGKDHVIKHHISYGPAQQEPVAWTNWRELVGARHYRTPGWEMYADKRNPDDVAIYISPPAQRTWVGLTNKDVYECEPKTDWYDSVEFARAIEARLKEKNT